MAPMIEAGGLEKHGFIDRVRSLPIPRSAVLAARAVADTAIFA